MFFQLFLGGMTLKTMPSEKGSRLSTSSSSALPPSVIIWYISLSLRVICVKPAMKVSSRRLRSSSYAALTWSRCAVTVFKSATRDR